MTTVLPPRAPTRRVIQLRAELTNPASPHLTFIASYIEEMNLAIQDVAASTDPQALGVSAAEHAMFKALAATVQCLTAPGGPIKFLRWAVQNGYYEDAADIGHDATRPSRGCGTSLIILSDTDDEMDVDDALPPALSPAPPSPAHRHGDNDGQLRWKSSARAPSPAPPPPPTPRHCRANDAAFARGHAPPPSTTNSRGPKPGLTASIASAQLTYRAILDGHVPPGMPRPRISRCDDDGDGDEDFGSARMRTMTRSRVHGGKPPRVAAAAAAAAEEVARDEEEEEDEVGPARATRSRRGRPARGAAAPAAVEEVAPDKNDVTRTKRAARVAKNGHGIDDRGMPGPAPPRTELARLPRSRTASTAKKPTAPAKPAASTKPRAPRRSRRAQLESMAARGVIQIEDDVNGGVDPRTGTGTVRWVLDENEHPPPPRGPWDELAAVEGNVQIVVDWHPEHAGQVDWEGLKGWLRAPVERVLIAGKEVDIMTVPARSARAKMALQCDGKAMGGVEYRIRTLRQFHADQAQAMQTDP